MDSQFMVESFKVFLCNLLIKFILIKNNKSEPFGELGLPRGKIAQSREL